MLAVGDVCEELVGEPETGYLLGDLRTLALDQRDPVSSIAPG
jgi:hypothetical protein